MRIPMLLGGILFSTALLAAALPYDDKADAKADVQHALAAAQTEKLPVLVIFGANWCEDCRALDQALHTGKNAELISKNFKLVKVDVGNFDRNTDLAAVYGNPIKKGIPAAVVLSAGSEILYTTKGGELANARSMSDTGVFDFFQRVTQNAGQPAK